ncbi:autotransporter domain-containing protein [Campylobacter sp. RM5004]|uniref:autotransporter outer membrane beta-barrel domain-containing protein n=1 Tax=Campylobacter sp. RM5004 TaxID=1660078 RepID=UPI001EFB1A51|nr:autotransporter outer membrane beta-barrel domain-containing protein [Campylobacter sp. RM5004]ULO00676.1 autotransporter domain-containing protein [Campylobacter sp. RM5004]
MKNVLRLSIALTSALYSYTTSSDIIGDLAQRVEIKQSGISSITANKVDDKINANFTISGNLTTTSTKDNILIFDYTQANLVYGGIVIKTGGNFTDNGSTFKAQGFGPYYNNIPAIKINGGIATLNNSSVFAGEGNHSSHQNAPAIEVSKGTLNLKNSLVSGAAQRFDSSGLIQHKHQAIDVIGFGTDKVYLNISGSIIKSGEDDTSALAIMAKENSTIVIDDTLNKGTNIIGNIISSGDFTIKGIYKNQATFNAKDILSNINITNNNIFDTTINARIKTNLEKNANIDKTYIGGGLDLNKSAESLGAFNITNSYIAGDIINAHDITIVNDLTPAGKSSIVLDNVYLEGFLTNYAGDIKSSNSVFNKAITSKYVSKIDDTNSIFKGGFSADEILLNGSILEGFKLTSISDAKYSGKNFTLTNIKVGKDLDNTKGYLELNGGLLKATNSALNYDIRSNSAINIDLMGSSLVGSFKDLSGNKISANKVSLNNSTSLGAFSTNELVANNSTFFLGGTSATYNGAIISKTSTSGANNSFGILGVVSKANDEQLIASGLSANMPLAILKGANSDFANSLKFYSGISEYALANSYLKTEKVGDYQVYVLAKDNKQNFNDLTYKNNSKLDINKINEIIADNNKLSDLVDFGKDLLASNEAKELINQNANTSLENKGTMVNDLDKITTPENPDTKPNPDIPWTDLEPSTPIIPTPDPKPEVPEEKPNPDIPWTDLEPSKPIEPSTPEEKPENPDTKPNPDIPWTDLTPANPIDPTPDPKPENPSDEEKFEIAVEEQKEAIKLMVTGKNEKALESAKLMTNQFYFSQVFEYNNLNKRLGELRGFAKNNAGIWIRGYVNKGSIKNTSLKANEVQMGVDKISSFTDFDTYAGFMLNIGRTTTSNTTNSKINNYGLGVYFSSVYNNGFFIDTTLKANHYKSEFKNDNFLGNSTSKGTGVIASFELGKRFGDDFYIEPSTEMILNYIPKTDIKGEKEISIGALHQKSFVNITAPSKLLVVNKTAIYTGINVNDSLNVRAGLGAIIDLTNNPDFLVSDGISSYSFKGASKDKRGFASLGINKNFNKKFSFSLEAEKTFSGNLNIDYNINTNLRYEF